MAWKKLKLDWNMSRWHVGVMLFYLVLCSGLYQFAFEGYMLSKPDLVQYIGMAQERKAHEQLTGEKVHWTNAMFGGMPTYQIGGTKGGFNWSKTLRSWMNSSFGSFEIIITFIGMLSAYLLALALGISPWWAATVGVAFGLNTIVTLYLGAGHGNKVNAIVLMPGVLAGVITAYKGRLWRGVFWTILFTSLHLSANHLQMTYYLLILLLAVSIGIGVKAYQEGTLKRFFVTSLWVALAGIGASLPSLAELFHTQRYSQYTTRGEAILDYREDGAITGSDGRVHFAGNQSDNAAGMNSGAGLGKEYILEYSMSPMEWLAAMCPNFKGGAEVVETTYQGQRARIPVYWGEQKYSAGAMYFGVLVMFFFLAFLLIGNHWLRWPFASVTLLVIFLSWRDSTVLTDFFLNYVPLFNKFRDTKMMLVLLQMMAGVGAVLMLMQLTDWGRERAAGVLKGEAWKQVVRKVAGAFGGLFVAFLAFYLFPDSLLGFEPELKMDPLGSLNSQFVRDLRVKVFREDVLRTLGLMVVGLAMVIALLWGKIQAKYVAMTLLAIQAIDLWNVNFRYHSNDLQKGGSAYWISEVDYHFPYRPKPVHLKLLQTEAPQGEEFESAQSKLYAKYKEEFPRRLRPEDQELLTQISSFDAMRMKWSPFRVLKFENPYTETETSYFFNSVGGYHGAKLQRYQDFMEVILARDRARLQKASQEDRLQEGLRSMWGHRMMNTRYLLVNDETYIPMPAGPGPAWFVQSIVWAATSNDEILSTLDVASFDEAVLPLDQKEDVPYAGPTGENKVTLIERHPEWIAYDVESERGGVVVFSEVNYPLGWSARIDGEPAELVRANFLFRGISVPPGAHRVEMIFEDSSGTFVGLASMGGVVSMIFLLFALVWSFRDDQTTAA